MDGRLCVFFVEGYWDEEFIQRVIQPLVETRYFLVKIITYSGLTPAKRKTLFNEAVRAHSDVFILADRNPSPCITAAKQRMKGVFQEAQVEDYVVIVVPEIEAWYLAGMSDAFAAQYQIGLPPNVDAVDKNRFEELCQHSAFDSSSDMRLEALRHYSVELAKQRSASFLYFAHRLGI